MTWPHVESELFADILRLPFGVCLAPLPQVLGGIFLAQIAMMIDTTCREQERNASHVRDCSSKTGTSVRVALWAESVKVFLRK